MTYKIVITDENKDARKGIFNFEGLQTAKKELDEYIDNCFHKGLTRHGRVEDENHNIVYSLDTTLNNTKEDLN